MIYESRTAADPVLNQIAKRLLTVQWQFDLTTDEQNVCTELEHSQVAPRRLITLMRDYKTWVIRMGIAGAQRTFGYYSNAKSGNLAPAFRYADMIRMYFWAYKRRDAYEPGDNDLNISADRAKMDLVHEVEVIQIIKDIELHLQSIGAILSPEASEKHLQDKVARQRAKPTLKLVVAESAEVFRHALADITKDMNQQLTMLTQEMKRQFLAQIEAMGRLERMIAPSVPVFLPPATFCGDPPPIVLPPQPPFFPSDPYRTLPGQPRITCDGTVGTIGGDTGTAASLLTASE